MTEVANLTAKIGFKISPTEFAQIRNTLKSLQQEIQKAVQEAARFANELTKISRGTGVGGRVIQQFRQLGINASVGANAMDSMLRSTSSLAQKSYWGFTNQLSQWGIYLTRSETAASALMKVMRGASGASPQRQREIFEAAGLPFEEAVLVLEQLQRSGFKLSDAIGMNDEELANMNRVSALIDKIKFNTEGFVNGLVGTQGDTFANGLELVEGVLSNVQKMILGIARDPGVKSGVANFLNFGALFTGFVTLTEKASDSFKGITQGVAFITKTAIWTTLVALLSRLFLGNRQKIAQTFKKAFPAGAGFLDSLFNSPMLLNAVKQAREKLKGVDFWGKEYLEDYLGDIENKGVFEATASRLDRVVDTLLDKLEAFWTTVYNGLLEVVKFAIQQITITLLTVWNEIKKGFGEVAKGFFGDALDSDAMKKRGKEVADLISADIDAIKIKKEENLEPKKAEKFIGDRPPIEYDPQTHTVKMTPEVEKYFNKYTEIHDMGSKTWHGDMRDFMAWEAWSGILGGGNIVKQVPTRKEFIFNKDDLGIFGLSTSHDYFDINKRALYDKQFSNVSDFYSVTNKFSSFWDYMKAGAAAIYGSVPYAPLKGLVGALGGVRPLSDTTLESKGIYATHGAPVIQITYNSDDTINVNSVDEAMVCQNKDLRSELQSMGNTAIQQWLANIKCAGDL